MLYPEMRPVEPGSPGVGRPTKPKPVPVSPPSPVLWPPSPPVQEPPGKDASNGRNHNNSGRDGSKDNGDRQEPAAVKQVKVEYAPDIVWLPEGIAASGQVTFRKIDSNLGGQPMLPDISGVQSSRDDPIEMEFYLAARFNPLLLEMMTIDQMEGIPPALEGNVDSTLRLSSEYGVDEEHDAEARRFLEYMFKRRLEPIVTRDDSARGVALAAFGANTEEDSFKKYKAEVEQEYGVEFTVGEGADEWNLANIVMSHAALEMAASVFGNRLREMSGLDIDDASAFRMIFGPITLNHSTEVRREAHAEVFGPLIKMYWKRTAEDDRNYNLLPYVLLHELGHRLNTAAGFGEGWGALSMNKLELGRPKTRSGMGKWARLPLHTVLGVYEGHGMYGAADLDAAHVQKLQYGAEADRNEVTADAVLNWLVHQSTGGESGFADTADGQAWLEYMDRNMDAWIRQAVAFGIMRAGDPVRLTDDERARIPFPLPVGRTVLAGSAYVRPGPAVASGDVSGGSPLPKGSDVVILGQNAWEEDSKYPEWVAVFYRGDINWIYRGRVDLPEEIPWGALPVLDNDRKLTHDPSIASLDDGSWFAPMLKAVYGGSR